MKHTRGLDRRSLGVGGLCVALLVVLASAGAWQAPQRSPAPILVLVSLDGFRPDYSRRTSTPNLDALATRGVQAEALLPVFPPQTFPNHYTLVTGLYPEHHGIVGNAMDDPSIPDRFTMSAPTALDSRWWGGEPLWATASRQGLRTASMFWPGSEVEIGGVRPTYWFPFDDSKPSQERVDQVLRWLALPDAERPSFITLYFSDVDHAGHDYGPESQQVLQAARRLDEQLGSLVSGIQRLDLLARTTIAVVSDHGMAQVDESRVIFLDDYLDPARVSIVQWSPVLALNPRAGDEQAVYSALKGKHPSMRVFLREETPPAFHYRTSPRIPPVLAVADEGWTITSHARLQEDHARGRKMGGAHGYDPAAPSMRALFVAAGPRLRPGLRVGMIENVHLYELFCAILGLSPAPNDGDAAVTRAWLRN
jgi:predicted AlkP superfamily pyrophosphatase or phosphodiesterase